MYAAIGYMSRLWSGSRGRGRYGGRKHRARVWSVMRFVTYFNTPILCHKLTRTPHRRIERLLIATSGQRTVGAAASIDPRTSGLLLLSTTHLRSYADRRLPSNSRLHNGFLEDVADLEDPGLGRDEKLRVVDRMWNSWGRVLGWYDIADKH